MTHFHHVCSTPPSSTPNSLPMTGIRRPSLRYSARRIAVWPSWLNQLLSQVMSPRLASTSAVSTRRSTPRRNSFNNDLTTTVAASHNSDGFQQPAAASGSPQQVPASVVNPWLSADVWSSTRKQVRGEISQFQELKGLCRDEKEIEIWKVCKLCPKGAKAEVAVQGKYEVQKKIL